MHPILRLTDYEKQWNWYHDAPDGRRGVLHRIYPTKIQINSNVPSVTVTHAPTRRSRIFSVTWTGDVYGLDVNIVSSVGAQLTTQPAHIPLLSGHSPYSTLSSNALIAPYPAFPEVFALQAGPRWELELDPNFVLGGGAELQFTYTLENPTDPVIQAGATYTVWQAVWSWEFPGFEGGAR